MIGGFAVTCIVKCRWQDFVQSRASGSFLFRAGRNLEATWK